MGNLRKFKRKANNNYSSEHFIRSLNKDGLTILKRLVQQYIFLLKKEDWEKIEAMIKFGIENTDPMVLEAVSFVNELTAKKMGVDYQALFRSRDKRLRFLIDNPQYNEYWLTDKETTSEDEMQREQSLEEKNLFSQQSDDLLKQYLDAVETSNKKK